MSYTNPPRAEDVGAEPHDPATMLVRLPDDDQRLLSGIQASAALTALTGALQQPVPADPDRVNPAMGVTGGRTAYAWRDATNRIHLDPAGDDRPVTLTVLQAAVLAEDLSLWVAPAQALVIPPQRSAQ